MLCDYIALMFFYVIISLLIYYGVCERRGVETNAATIHSSSLFAITVLSHLLRMFFCLIYFTVPGLLGMCSSFSVAQRLVHSRVSYIFLLRNLRCHVYMGSRFVSLCFNLYFNETIFKFTSNYAK